MAMTQKEIDTLIEKVKTGAYTIEDALKEIADSAKGKDVRKALYALGYTLNQEGKAGSVDLLARKELESKASKTELSTETSERKQEIAVERARIDQFTSLAEGSTTGDAELQDIRVGADGKIYDNAGEAVRGQIGELKDDILTKDISILNVYNVDFKPQSNISNTGELSSYSYCSATENYITISPSVYKKLFIYNMEGDFTAQIGGNAIAFYDSDKQFINYHNYYNKIIDVPENARYFRYSYYKSKPKFVNVTGIYDGFIKQLEENINTQKAKVTKKEDAIFDLYGLQSAGTNTIINDQGAIVEFAYGEAFEDYIPINSILYKKIIFLTSHDSGAYPAYCDNIAFYDADKQFISKKCYAYNVIIDVPENAKYFRYSWYTKDVRPKPVDITYIYYNYIKPLEQKNIPFDGKFWHAFGDSNTWGASYYYTSTVSKITGMNLTNHGVVGNGTKATLDVIKNSDLSDAEVITLMIGTNNDDVDTINATSLMETLPSLSAGKSLFNLPYDDVNSVDDYISTYPDNSAGHIALSVELFQYKAPNAKIFLITPPPLYYHVGNHKSSDMIEYGKLIKMIGDRYGVQVIDPLGNCGINLLNFRTYYSYDGTHLNDAGAGKWGNYIGNEINKSI